MALNVTLHIDSEDLQNRLDIFRSMTFFNPKDGVEGYYKDVLESYLGPAIEESVESRMNYSGYAEDSGTASEEGTGVIEEAFEVIEEAVEAMGEDEEVVEESADVAPGVESKLEDEVVEEVEEVVVTPEPKETVSDDWFSDIDSVESHRQSKASSRDVEVVEDDDGEYTSLDEGCTAEEPSSDFADDYEGEAEEAEPGVDSGVEEIESGVDWFVDIDEAARSNIRKSSRVKSKQEEQNRGTQEDTDFDDFQDKAPEPRPKVVPTHASRPVIPIESRKVAEKSGSVQRDSRGTADPAPKSYKDVRDFVKQNRGCTSKDILTVFSQKELQMALMKGKVFEKYGKYTV